MEIGIAKRNIQLSSKTQPATFKAPDLHLLVCKFFGVSEEEEGKNFEFGLFRPPGAQKCPNLVPKFKNFIFVVEGAILHRSSPYLVCKLFGSGLKKRPKFGTKIENFSVSLVRVHFLIDHHHFEFVSC